jgi:hypothetical protein
MNEWVSIPGCGAVVITGSPIQMDALTVIGPNVASPLTQTPDMMFCMMVINGQVFMPIGASPPFSVSGTTITWLSTIYGFNIGDTVNAAYTWGGDTS